MLGRALPREVFLLFAVASWGKLLDDRLSASFVHGFGMAVQRRALDDRRHELRRFKNALETAFGY